MHHLRSLACVDNVRLLSQSQRLGTTDRNFPCIYLLGDCQLVLLKKLLSPEAGLSATAMVHPFKFRHFELLFVLLIIVDITGGR